MKIFILTLLYSFNVFAIYGSDTRMDYHQIKDAKLKEVARAIAFQTYKDDSVGWDFSRTWKLKAGTLADKGVCKDENFSWQPAFSRPNCTAILVAPNQILTAGNCTTEHYCDNDLFYFVFNYHVDQENSFTVERPKKDFYQCKKIVKRVFVPSSKVSFTLIELEKEVKGVTPVKVNLKDTLTERDELYVMGHNYGAPLKISLDTMITEIKEKHFFTNSDIGGDNAGSVLINPKTLELEGILIDGSADYVQTQDGCKRPVSFSYSEGYELALKTSVIFK